MSKVLVVFASMTGNTEEIADLIEEGLQSEGAVVDKYDVLDVDASKMEEYDSIILGAYTWGEGEIPDEFEEFYDEMAGMDLTGKSFAVFGSGDRSYEYFCGAVDLIEAMISETGGTVILDGLKIELNPDGDDHDKCLAFGVEFGKQLSSINI